MMTAEETGMIIARAYLQEKRCFSRNVLLMIHGVLSKSKEDHINDRMNF